MVRSSAFHEDAFYGYFHPIRHPEAHHNIWGGLGLETYGEDLNVVHACDANYLWTVCDGDNATQWIVPGFHQVNRICYLVTAKPHHFVPIEFRVRNDSLTPLGLRRQVTRLMRLTMEYAAA